MISRRERILALMDQIRPVNKYAAAELVEEFLREELNRNTADNPVKLQDLTNIHSMAILTMKELNFLSLNHRGYSSIDDARTWSFVSATIQWLRSKELIAFTLKYEKERK